MKTTLRLAFVTVAGLSSITCAPDRLGDPFDDEEMNQPNEADRCSPDIDSDFDGLKNDYECILGTNPFKADSDNDGILDGVELKYPKACVNADSKAQRRPPQECNSQTDCQAGEKCRGLDPNKNDSDGDGVLDGQEDPNFDGKIESGNGETDPRLIDTDGDGKNDNMGGLAICRPDGLAQVKVVGVPMGGNQVGHDPAWGMGTPVTGTMGRGAVVFDDPLANVAGVTFGIAMTGMIRDEATKVENAIVAAIGGGITPVLTGRALTTHELNAAVTSTYRIAKASNASALRDQLVNPLIGTAAPGGASTGASSEFILDVTTVRRGGTRGDVIVTIAPRMQYEDPTKDTQIRTNDLVNTTAVAESGKTVGSACQVFKTGKQTVADFLWTVDTSGSMSDDQERLGNTATKFFSRLTAAGVDFRVGVVTAGETSFNIDNPGFKFIDGKDPNGPIRLCQEVTTGQCPMGGAESLQPYPMAGGTEEPTAAAIVGHYTFKKRGAMGEMNPDRKFRDNAKVVAFLVTDEPGSNDFSRYFQTSTDPETGMQWGNTYNAMVLSNIINYFKRNQVLTFGLVPKMQTACSPTPNVYDLPRCVIEGNGGASIPIETALAAEVDAAMTKIVDAVAGATSQFKLDRSPITSTIKVRLRGSDVPRSRAEGFDYDAVSKSVIFYGNTYRPKEGDEVVVSYRVWAGSVG